MSKYETILSKIKKKKIFIEVGKTHFKLSMNSILLLEKTYLVRFHCEEVLYYYYYYYYNHLFISVTHYFFFFFVFSQLPKYILKPTLFSVLNSYHIKLMTHMKEYFMHSRLVSIRVYIKLGNVSSSFFSFLQDRRWLSGTKNEKISVMYKRNFSHVVYSSYSTHD